MYPRFKRPSRGSTAVMIVAAAVMFTAIGCKREERGYRVQAPSAQRIDSMVMPTILPGPSFTPEHVKNGYEENAVAVSQGKQLYSSFNCVGCHAHGGGGMGPPLIDEKWIYGSEPEQIFATIVEGRPNGMPAFRQRIPDFQVWQLVAYVRSLSGQLSRNVATNRDDHMYYMQPETTRPRLKPINAGEPQ